MSAFDIAGAVVWTPLAVLFFKATIACRNQGDSDATFIGVIATIGISVCAAFCIARLFGAGL